MERAHLGRPGAVNLGYLSQFECAGHWETSFARGWFERRQPAGGGRRGRRPLPQANIGGIEPADDRFQPEELGVDDERQRHVVLSGRGFDLA